jgi:hypothetical protein
MKNTVACIVYDEQIVRPVVVEEEVANVLVELQLWPLSDIELDGLGFVVEAVAEKFFELYGL